MKKLPVVNAFKSGNLSLVGQENILATFNGTDFVNDKTGEIIAVTLENFSAFTHGLDVLQHQNVLEVLKAKPVDEIVVIYHGGCPDGVASAIVAVDFLGTDVKIVPGHYKRTLEEEKIDIKNKTVILCDFSYPLEEMQTLVNQAERIIFLDHHNTPLTNLSALLAAPNVFAFASTKYSGASLTWSFFNPEKEMPLFIQYIEDGDLYTFNLPDARNLIKGFHSILDKDVDKNLQLLVDKEVVKQLPHISLIGKVINDEAVRQAKGIIKQGRMTATAYGHVFPLINATPDHTNLIGELIYTTEKVPFVMIYTILANRVKISMRSSASEVDVASLANNIFTKGGGHKTAAAGFMPLEQFLKEVLNNAVEYIEPVVADTTCCGCGSH